MATFYGHHEHKSILNEQHLRIVREILMNAVRWNTFTTKFMATHIFWSARFFKRFDWHFFKRYNVYTVWMFLLCRFFALEKLLRLFDTSQFESIRFKIDWFFSVQIIWLFVQSWKWIPVGWKPKCKQTQRSCRKGKKTIDSKWIILNLMEVFHNNVMCSMESRLVKFGVIFVRNLF